MFHIQRREHRLKSSEQRNQRRLSRRGIFRTGVRKGFQDALGVEKAETRR